jgi:hypothetical protein
MYLQGSSIHGSLCTSILCCSQLSTNASHIGVRSLNFLTKFCFQRLQMFVLEEFILDSNLLTLVPRTLYEDTTSLTLLSLVDNPIVRLPTELGQVCVCCLCISHQFATLN